jgi:hypothetical protein
MNRQSGTKINRLLRIWPKGTVAAQSWLEKQDIDRRLMEVYRRGGWVEKIAPGAYIHAGDSVDWTGAIYSLQKQLNLQVHVAATTALVLQGLGQYMPLGKGGLSWVFGDSSEKRKIPKWFKQCFSKKYNIQIVKTKVFSHLTDGILSEINYTNYSVLASSPERALFECLYLTPEKLSLEHASQLMENARTLRHNVVQTLLEHCASIKVKRLFLFLADLHQHVWLNRIDLGKVELGRGTRQIGGGGNFIAKYKLSLPNLKSHEGYTDENEDS